MLMPLRWWFFVAGMVSVGGPFLYPGWPPTYEDHPLWITVIRYAGITFGLAVLTFFLWLGGRILEHMFSKAKSSILRHPTFTIPATIAVAVLVTSPVLVPAVLYALAKNDRTVQREAESATAGLLYHIISDHGPANQIIFDTEFHHPFGGSIDVRPDSQRDGVFWIVLNGLANLDSCISVLIAADIVADLLVSPAPALHAIVVRPDTHAYTAPAALDWPLPSLRAAFDCEDHWRGPNADTAAAVYLQFGPRPARDKPRRLEHAEEFVGRHTRLVHRSPAP